MAVSFRQRLLFIVGTSMFAGMLLVGVSASIAARQTRDLAEVEGRLVPRVQLGPRIRADFDRLSRSFQDAVAAQDRSALDATGPIRDGLLTAIDSARGSAMTADDARALRAAVRTYYDTALAVSRQMIDGESGDALNEQIERMQAQQVGVRDLVARATKLDPQDLARGFEAVRSANRTADRWRLLIGLISVSIVGVLGVWATRRMLRVLDDLSGGFSRFATGNFDKPILETSDDEFGKLAREANAMAANLQRLAERRDHDDWIKGGLADLSDEVRGNLEPPEVARRALAFLARRLDVLAGALYVGTERGTWQLAGHHALAAEGAGSSAPTPLVMVRDREGLIGELAHARETRLIDNSDKAFTLRSGLCDVSPGALAFVPLAGATGNTGVIELALSSGSTRAVEFLDAARGLLAATLDVAQARAVERDLLEKTQALAERLSSQEEELRMNNQELESQQDELRNANAELEQQRRALAERNSDLEESRKRIQQQVEELGRVSTYKSQFLANMSHELRTPLNSMLLLSHLLSENDDGNLTRKQVEHCLTIHSAGSDLLELINGVLDLSKIEAGKQDVDAQPIVVADLAQHLRRAFGALAADKGLALDVKVESDMPERIVTDRQRLDRILGNLVANALKFTDRGGVSVRFHRPVPGARFERHELSESGVVAVEVADTGIGIAADARDRVFAPFEQLEARANRRYPGTGLGLAIARESAWLIGGEIRLESEPDKGSTFTVYLPERVEGPASAPSPKLMAAVPVVSDAESLGRTPSLLVIEDDPVLAEQLSDIIRARRFEVLLARTGEEGLTLARARRPHGIILDVRLPDIDGWTVMERLRRDPSTRGVPVHFVSGVDDPARGLALGAVGYMMKPATHTDLAAVVRTLTRLPVPGSRVLVVEDNRTEAEAIVALLHKEKLEARHVDSVRAALALLETEAYGCIILDLGLRDMDGLELLEALKTRVHDEPPRVVVYTARSLTKKETHRLEEYAQAVILKDGNAEDRLRDEIRLFVRHVKEQLPPAEAVATRPPAPVEVSLGGVELLIMEDDMRTVYALSALLRSKGAEVRVAETGREGLAQLDAHSGVRCVLMDLMMPEMDGYETLSHLRADARFADLPVVVLTARAMAGERERCIEAGANAYLTKPIDNERLFAALADVLRKQKTNGAQH